MAWKAAVGAALIFAVHVLPQEVRVSSRPYTPPPLTLRAETDLVEVGVVVRDHDGRAIAGLTKQDFKLLDDGKQREIAGFSIETTETAGSADSRHGATQPAVEAGGGSESAAVARERYVGLLFDDVHMSRGEVLNAKAAAERFVKEALEPRDYGAILTTSGTETHSFSSNKTELVNVIRKIREHPRMSEDGLAPCPRITPYQAYRIVSLDVAALGAAIDEEHACTESPDPMRPRGSPPTALGDGSIGSSMVQSQAEQTWEQAKTISKGTLDVVFGAVDALIRMRGSRVLVLVSSGFLAGTLDSDQSRIVDRAIRGGVVINVLDAKGQFAYTPTRTPDQLENVTSLPMTTASYEMSSQGNQLGEMNAPLENLAASTGGLFFHNSNDLAAGLRELAAVPTVTYYLGFHLESRDNRYHKLKVEVTGPKPDFVEARRGYFAAKEDREDGRDRLDREVMGREVMGDFPVHVTAEPDTSHIEKPVLWVTVHVDVRALRFVERDQRQLQGLVFVTSLWDAAGNFVTAKEGRMDLELREETFKRLCQGGINAKLKLDVLPGDYRLREVVREAVDGKMASSNQAVAVR